MQLHTTEAARCMQARCSWPPCLPCPQVFVGRGTTVAGAGVQRALTVTGPGVVVTQSTLALAALTVLEERGKIKALGFSTPAAVFRDTSYWAKLVEW